MLHDCIPFVFELRTACSGLAVLRLCLPLPTLVPQRYSALFVSILSGESKELITMVKARGYSGEKASGMISIRLVQARDHFIYDLLTCTLSEWTECMQDVISIPGRVLGLWTLDWTVDWTLDSGLNNGSI